MELKYNTLYQLCDLDHDSYERKFEYYFTLDPQKTIPVVKKSKTKDSATKIYGNNFWGNPNSQLLYSSKFVILGILSTHKNEYTFNGRKYKILYDTKGFGILDIIKQVYIIDIENKFKELSDEHILKCVNSTSIPDENAANLAIKDSSIENMNEVNGRLKMQNDELKSILLTKTKKCEYLEKKVQENERKSELERQKLQEQIDFLTKNKEQFEAQINELKFRLANESKKNEDLEKRIQEKITNKEKEEDSSSSHIQCKQRTVQILGDEDISNIERGDQIGQGKCGSVVKVYVKHEQALKELDKNDSRYEDLKHLMNEYETMNMLNHINILKVHGIFLGNETTSPSILLDYCKKNLENEINEKSLSKVQIVCIIYQIVSGMKYVHLNKIIHRDLKPSDILIDDEGIVKICDFGLSKLLSADDLATTINVGTANFMSPEIMNGEDEYTEKVDVYSFGVLLYFVLSGGQMPNISSFDVCMGKKAKIPKGFTDFSRELINSCWSFEAIDRPSFKEICDQIEESNYALLDVTKAERDHILDFIREYKTMLPNYSS